MTKERQPKPLTKREILKKNDWRKRFEKFWREGNYGYNHIGKNTMRDFISQELKREKEEALEEAVKLSDEIEAGKETTFEEWKAFKRFRNTLRDRLKNLKEREGK